MIHSPEKIAHEEETSTFCERLWKAIETVFGNPRIHPCVGYRPVMWQYARFVEAFEENVEPEHIDNEKSKLKRSP